MAAVLMASLSLLDQTLWGAQVQDSCSVSHVWSFLKNTILGINKTIDMMAKSGPKFKTLPFLPQEAQVRVLSNDKKHNIRWDAGTIQTS